MAEKRVCIECLFELVPDNHWKIKELSLEKARSCATILHSFCFAVCRLEQGVWQLCGDGAVLPACYRNTYITLRRKMEGQK